MRKKCTHGKQKSICKECGGVGICEHGRQKSHCKECGGSAVCEHGRQKSRCKECGGSGICEHGRRKSYCKECGRINNNFQRNAFTKNQIKEIGAIKVCQFPDCLVQSNSLHSDHYHDGDKINPNNYRGEICYWHNGLLSVFDAHPEQANPEAAEYMKRRPFMTN